MPRLALVVIALAATLLTGCEMLGFESSEKLAAARDADGRAVGGACRHAARAIEDCYTLNRKADKAAVFAGWRDMNDYMRENKIEPVAPQQPTQLANAGARAEAGPDTAPGVDKRSPPSQADLGKDGAKAGKGTKAHDS